MKKLFCIACVLLWHLNGHSKNLYEPETSDAISQVTSTANLQHESSIVIRGNRSVPSNKLFATVVHARTGDAIQRESRIKKAVEAHYRKEGFLLPIVTVVLSKKKVSISVIEGKIRNIRVLVGEKDRNWLLGNQNFSKLLQDIKSANPILTKQLERYILLMQKIHGLNVSYKLIPISNPVGNEVADIDISIIRRKGQASLYADSNGVSKTGPYQFLANVQNYNLISNDSFRLNAGTTSKYDRFKYVSGGYLKRLTPYGTSISVMATYSVFDPYKASGSKNGELTSLYGRFDQYLIINNDYSVKLELKVEQVKFNFYRVKEKLWSYKYPKFAFGSKIKIVDAFHGENWFYPYYYWTLKDANYSTSSTLPINFDKSFGYFLVNWNRTQQINDKFSFAISASYQGTKKKLPVDALYSIGSKDTVKGYDLGLVSADQGITGNAELRYNYKLAQFFGFYGVTQFIDRPKANNSKYPNRIYFDKSTFESVGCGIRPFLPHKFFGEISVAQPLLRHVTVNSAKHKNKTKYNFYLAKIFNW